jgi:hypothetical protein
MNDQTLDQKVQADPILPRILQEIAQAQEGTLIRQGLIKKFEEESKKNDGKSHKLLVYMTKMSHPRNANSINPDDIAPIGSILQSFDGAEVIDLFIQSPGGDGNTAEKVVDMCRAYLSDKGKLRVIIPNKAKSAATLIALGADEIVMGYSSELGPIDAQIPINASGIVQFISAQSFIDARDELLKKTHEAIHENKEYQGYLQLLTTVNTPFVKECERSMAFARDIASKWLDKYMLKSKIKDAAKRKKLAEAIASKLSSAEKYLSHGRMINANSIMDDDDLKKLEIRQLQKNDPLWHLLWEIYVRSEVYLGLNQNPQQIKAKLFESSSSSLTVVG